MNLRPQDIVRNRRTQLGHTDTEVADRIGVSIDQYCELEEERDEYYMVVPLAKIAALCDVLKLDINDIFGLTPCSLNQCNESFVQQKRSNKGLTTVELSKRIGISEECVLALEQNPQSVGNWVMDPLMQLSIELDIPPVCLLECIKSPRKIPG